MNEKLESEKTDKDEMIVALLPLFTITQVKNKSTMPKPIRTNKLLYASLIVMLPILLEYNTTQGNIETEMMLTTGTMTPVFFSFFIITTKFFLRGPT